ncbi:MAG: leucine-rich repeat domain-containing protein [Candidatus Heimdallarchaeota archaeon]|nr:leucine-rich repeat domain-containing protein [Candidatus Heimdallarchaeota archaeon]
MKKKMGFVANSSSHTFILYLNIALFDVSEYQELIDHNFSNRLYLNETELLAGLNSFLNADINILEFEKYPERFAKCPELTLSWETHVHDVEYSSLRQYDLSYHKLLLALDDFRRRFQDRFSTLLAYQLVGETDCVDSVNPTLLEFRELSLDEQKKRYNFYFDSREEPRYEDTINIETESNYQDASDFDFSGYDSKYNTYPSLLPDEFKIETRILDLNWNKLRFTYGKGSNGSYIKGIFSNGLLCLQSYKFFKELEILILNNANIEEIPSFVYNLEKLKILNLANNKIKEISVKINQLHNLRELYLTDNNINNLPELTIPLVVLAISNNHLKKLPSIKRKTLQKLFVDHNRQLSADAKEICSLPDLLRLDIDQRILSSNEEIFCTLLDMTSIYDEKTNQWGLKLINDRFFDNLPT